MIVFRFLHIMPGVLWVSSSFLSVGIIGPSAAKVGPSAGPLMSEAVKGRRAAKVITALGGINVVAGWLLCFRNADLAGSLGDWLTSGFGLGLTIGGILATLAAVVGAVGVGRGVERLVDLSDGLAAAGEPPTPEQQARARSAVVLAGTSREARPRTRAARYRCDGDGSLLVAA